VADPDARDVLDGLDPGQREAVTSEAAPLRILAGAGSGKTRVLTRRIAYRCATGSADAAHVLALTFTRKAATEMQRRVTHLGLRGRVTAGTFHAVAYAQLRTYWADRSIRPPDLLERKGRILARFVPRRSGDVTAADFAQEIEWAKARMVTPDRYVAEAGAAARRAPLAHGAMADVFRRYEEEKQRARLVDFDDLLSLCAASIETDLEYAAAQRWRFRHLFVDEFQDVNPLQLRLLDAWRGERPDLCVVGDPNQAIYAWNGADPSILRDFGTRHPTAVTVMLDRNYRSAPQVLAVANAVLAAGAASTGAGPRLTRLVATRPDGPIPSVRSFATDVREARAVVRAARDLHGPSRPWSQQAVLTRTNAQTVLLERAFRAAGLPFRLRGRTPFLELPEIKEALRDLRRTSANLGEGLAALEARLAVDPEADPDDDADAGADVVTGRPGLSDAELARRQNLAVLLRLANEYTDSDRGGTAEGLAAWLAATVRGDDADGPADAVDVTTFHAAKGLEWQVVHLAGLEAGLVPIGHARTAEAEAEERRLFYVAITRAERELHMSWAEQRMFGTRPAKRTRSPYLIEVDHVLAALAAGAAPDDWRPHLGEQRDRLRAANRPRAKVRGRAELDTAGAELFDALKQWRAQAAKAAAVPAYVIFHDSTLEAVARERPGDRHALLALPGIGPVKVNRFGDDVLAVVALHDGG
jgi:DNA helicase-2/ATP-dependent DNA helicase PcrA